MLLQQVNYFQLWICASKYLQQQNCVCGTAVPRFIVMNEHVTQCNNVAHWFCTNIHSSHKINPHDFGDPLPFLLAPLGGWHSDWNVLTSNGCIAMQFDTAFMLAPFRMNWNNFGNPLTFHLAPSPVQKFYLSNTLLNTRRTKDVPISMCLMLINKCLHANTLN